MFEFGFMGMEVFFAQARFDDSQGLFERLYAFIEQLSLAMGELVDIIEQLGEIVHAEIDLVQEIFFSLSLIHKIDLTLKWDIH